MILAEIEKLDIFADIRSADFDEALAAGKISYISDSILTNFIEEVKNQSVLYGDKIDKSVAIVYSPLNGTGLRPVTRVLSESGFSNITIVEEQRLPDGCFPTCPYPNPEIREAMQLGLEYCEWTGADLLLATDPDCDRCGIAVKSNEGYQLLTGNEVGLLLLDYVCSQRSKHNKMPAEPMFVKTIVTTDLAERIASHYGVKTVNVLTGFKFIGEVIGRLEDKDNYICGFEESYGYLTGTYVRDKDGVNAASIICEMFAFYKTQGISLIEKLQGIYDQYGYCLNTLHSYSFEGVVGMQKIKSIMRQFRRSIDAIGGFKIEQLLDYNTSIDGLPKSDVLKFIIEKGSIVIRSSGTEPKLKVYISITAKEKASAIDLEQIVMSDIELRLNRDSV